MGFWNQMERMLTNVMDSATEHNKKRVQSNRLRTVIKEENKRIGRIYVALGKYYYESLRQKQKDQSAEQACRRIDASQERILRARQRLVALSGQEHRAASTDPSSFTAEALQEETKQQEWIEPETTEPLVHEIKTEEKEPAPLPKISVQLEESLRASEAAEESEGYIPPLPGDCE